MSETRCTCGAGHKTGHACNRCGLWSCDGNWYRRSTGKRIYPCKSCTKDYVRSGRLRTNYGISQEIHDGILAKQGNACAICGRTQPNGRGGWHLDHDRSCCNRKGSCGKCVRGLLCNQCNVALGMFNDNVSALRAAITYLEGSRAGNALYVR